MAICPSAFVPEVLRKDNYERWRILMQHHFEAQDLWEVVISNETRGVNEEQVWNKKTASALLAIKISCEGEVFDKIKEEMKSAKAAWDAVADMHKPSSVQPHEHVKNLVDGQQHEDAQEDVPDESEIRQHPEGYVQPQEDVSHKIRVDVSYEEGSSERLSKYIRYGRMRKVVSMIAGQDATADSNLLHKLLRKPDVNPDGNLLLKQDADGRIPVQLACSTGDERMTRFLYRMTPREVLKGDIGFHLLEECITKKMFDIAFDLLQNFPELADPSRCPSGSAPIFLTLAKTPPPFFRGSQLVFWKQWIYKCTRVKADSIKQIKDEKCNFFDNFGAESVVYILLIACCPWILLPRICEWICDIELSLTDARVILGQSLERAGQILGQSLGRAQKILKQSSACVPKVTHQSDDEFRGTPKGVLLGMLKLFGGLLVGLALMPFSIVTVIVAGVPISMRALILGRRVNIRGKEFECTFIADVLSKLVSLFSWAFARQVYDLKTMDEYAHKVISFVRERLSNLDLDDVELAPTLREATVQAIKNGIPDIVDELDKAYAKMMNVSRIPERSTNSFKFDMYASRIPEASINSFEVALAHRQEKVAQIIYESMDANLVTASEDSDQNNALDIVAKLAHSQLGRFSGAALHLQSEVRWFKSVEGIVPQFWKEPKHLWGETPSQVFAKEHKDLLKEAEEWIKKTAESSTVVGALIITIMFAAAFTVPGGNDQDTGYPIFLPQNPIPFMVFIVSDAISLFTASSSVLMFLGILTSRYAYDDFLKSLPIKLIIGLSSLFISIATMTTAFCATLFIMLDGRLEVVIPITLLACIPIAFFGWLQFPLLVEIYASTFRRNIFEKEKEKERESFLESWLTLFVTLIEELRTDIFKI